MGSTYKRSTTPDLFSGPATQAVPALGSTTATPANRTPTSTKRHILPNNLPAAVQHLDDSELEQLLSAILAERDRRGTKKPTLGVRKRQVNADAPSLTLGKLNAIRAAFRAGVTPSRIAREFGLSQSDVRKTLTTDRATR